MMPAVPLRPFPNMHVPDESLKWSPSSPTCPGCLGRPSLKFHPCFFIYILFVSSARNRREYIERAKALVILIEKRRFVGDVCAGGSGVLLKKSSAPHNRRYECTDQAHACMHENVSTQRSSAAGRGRGDIICIMTNMR